MNTAPADQLTRPEGGTESYKHRFAKETLAKWFRDASNEQGYAGITPIRARSNRASGSLGVWTEYPICIDKDNNLIGALPVWDESAWDGSEITDEAGRIVGLKPDSLLEVRPPTYAECLDMGFLPVVIFDVLIQHKGGLGVAVEVVHRNGISPTKADYLRRIRRETGVDVWTIDADWILSQVGRPAILRATKVVL
jgi:hypothetical protein